VIGGGPAGSFVSYFLNDMAGARGIDINVDIYEPRDFTTVGPAGCNHCGGIISESLVRTMAADGITIPSTVVQESINSYVLHMDVGNVRIDAPDSEKIIASVYRGVGPRGMTEPVTGNTSFDGFLQKLAVEKGSILHADRVDDIIIENGLPVLQTRSGTSEPYDLVVAAVGVNSSALGIFRRLDFGYRPPESTSTYISELPLGRDLVKKHLGSSMHVFFLNLPGLDFAALIPKGEFATVVLLGDHIDKTLVKAFLDSTEVQRCLPPQLSMPLLACQCSPLINVREAVQPYTDRLVFIGDCGVAKLYKDGIGTAYRCAKTVARIAVTHGVSARDFRKRYLPTYQAIARDNSIGKLVFSITRQIQQRHSARWSLLATVLSEQRKLRGYRGHQRMSSVLWDTFTGSASYVDIFVRTLHPVFLYRFLWNMLRGIFISV
jgi:flavin-dependent dehydrogenase